MTEQLPERQILTISQLNRRARLLLETHLPLLWVRGEISNFASPGSGHWYFTLKDDNAQIRCAMFRNRNNRVAVRPKNGDQVLVRGRVGLYETRGEYQLIAEHLEPDGAGLLQQRFEALKAKLQEEGLFAPELKQVLPPFPTHIGIVTSPTGAAIRDILQVLKRRSPWVQVSIFPAPVQGQAAVAGIVNAIEFANRFGECDLLVVGRGGGSIEDLWAFNEEAVARAIFASELPVVSAVGHETDFTIADFVADVRAPTPSAAAEIISPDGDTLLHRFQQQERQLARRFDHRIDQARVTLAGLMKRLRSPADKLREQTQQLDHLEIRLVRAWQTMQARRDARLELLRHRLQTIHPEKQLAAYRQHLAANRERLRRGMAAALGNRGQRLQALSGTLNAVSPLQTLERGYAIPLDNRQRIIRSITAVAPEDEVRVRLKDGVMFCEVVDTASDESRNGD